MWGWARFGEEEGEGISEARLSIGLRLLASLKGLAGGLPKKCLLEMGAGIK